MVILNTCRSIVHYILLRLHVVHYLRITNRSYPSENGKTQSQYTYILSCSEEEVLHVMVFQQQ